ncbi:MAG: hypothetical protein WBG08_04625, partial [Litorimonas sp.]
MSKLFRNSLAAAALLGGTLTAGSASATCTLAKPAPVKPCVDCSGPRTGTSTLPPLSSYFEHQSRCTGKTYTGPTTVRRSGGTPLSSSVIRVAPQTAIVQNGGGGAQTAIVQNSGSFGAQTAIVQNSGRISASQTAIVQNGGTSSAQTAIVQNGAVRAAPQTAIVQNGGFGSTQTAIVQNNTFNSRVVTAAPRIVTRAPRVVSRTVNTTRVSCGPVTWHSAC